MPSILQYGYVMTLGNDDFARCERAVNITEERRISFENRLSARLLTVLYYGLLACMIEFSLSFSSGSGGFPFTFTGDFFVSTRFLL